MVFIRTSYHILKHFPLPHSLSMSTTSSGFGEIRALVDIIKNTVDQLEGTIASRGQTYPSLSTPFSKETEAVRIAAPDVLALGDIVVSAAAQLIANVRPSASFPLLTALQVCSTGK
jgi:hypothetical protein